MSNSTNMEIRAAAKRAGVRLWQVAECVGVNDGNFSRRLRRELPPEERDKILDIIMDLAAKNAGCADA